MRQLIEDGITRFNTKSENDEKFRTEMASIERLVMIVVTDEKTYNFKLKDSHIEELHDGELENADITVISDSETLTGVYKGEKDALTEFSKKRLKVKAPLKDMLLARKFL